MSCVPSAFDLLLQESRKEILYRTPLERLLSGGLLAYVHLQFGNGARLFYTCVLSSHMDGDDARNDLRLYLKDIYSEDHNFLLVSLLSLNAEAGWPCS